MADVDGKMRKDFADNNRKNIYIYISLEYSPGFSSEHHLHLYHYFGYINFTKAFCFFVYGSVIFKCLLLYK